MGGRSKREGICVYIWLILFVVQQKLTQHCKATIPQFKKKKIVMPLEPEPLGGVTRSKDWRFGVGLGEE